MELSLNHVSTLFQIYKVKNTTCANIGNLLKDKYFYTHPVTHKELVFDLP